MIVEAEKAMLVSTIHMCRCLFQSNCRLPRNVKTTTIRLNFKTTKLGAKQVFIGFIATQHRLEREKEEDELRMLKEKQEARKAEVRLKLTKLNNEL